MKMNPRNNAGGAALLVLGLALAAGAALALVLQASGLSRGVMGYLGARDDARALDVTKAYAIAWSADPDDDDRNEPPAANADRLPSRVPAATMAASVIYCPRDQGNTNSADAKYTSSDPVAGDDAPAAILFRPGSNKFFTSSCASAEALGDDATKKIMRAEIETTPRAVGGLVDEGQTIRPVVQDDNVNLSQSLVTIYTADELPATDPAGDAIETGTVAYDSDDEEFAVYNGTEWKRFKLQ